MSDFNFDKSSQLPHCGSFCVGKYIALVGDCPENAKRKLESLPEILKVFTLPPDPLIDSPIANHPDTILCLYKNTLYCHKKYAEDNSLLLAEISRLTGVVISPQDAKRCGKYPYDIAFNAVVLPKSNTVIGKKMYLCAPLGEYAVNTNQGYAACCSLAVGDILVTADNSMAKAARSAGIEVFTVSGEDIRLSGYDKGFIGGAAGALNDKVFVFGSVQESDTGRELEAFCNERGFALISLCAGDVTDYGGIKFIPVVI